MFQNGVPINVRNDGKTMVCPSRQAGVNGNAPVTAQIERARGDAANRHGYGPKFLPAVDPCPAPLEEITRQLRRKILIDGHEMPELLRGCAGGVL